MPKALVNEHKSCPTSFACRPDVARQSSASLQRHPIGASSEILKEPAIAPHRARAATMVDVARLAGVSTMTVSRYINGRTGIRDTTRASIRTAIASLGFEPNLAARSLTLASGMGIGLLCCHPAAGQLSKILIGANERTRRANVPLLIHRCEPGCSPIECAQALVRRGVNGVILPPPLCDMPEVRAVFKDAGVATVLLASGEPPDDLASIGVDQTRAAREMTDHLIGLGHRRIGFVAGDLNHAIHALRLRGFREAVASSGIDADDLLVEYSLCGYRSGLDATERLLDLHTPPTAIFASDDVVAAAAVEIAHTRGLDVPGDISIVSFEDGGLASVIWPKLTAIRQPFTAMAGRAVELLMEITGDAITPSTRKPWSELSDFTLIPRQSDATPRRLPRLQ